MEKQTKFKVWDRVKIISETNNYSDLGIWYNFIIQEINNLSKEPFYRPVKWKPSWVIESSLELVSKLQATYDPATQIEPDYCIWVDSRFTEAYEKSKYNHPDNLLSFNKIEPMNTLHQEKFNLFIEKHWKKIIKASDEFDDMYKRLNEIVSGLKHIEHRLDSARRWLEDSFNRWNKEDLKEYFDIVQSFLNDIKLKDYLKSNENYLNLPKE